MASPLGGALSLSRKDTCLTTQQTYLANAASARAQAETADLANVRERCLRSEAAWNAMAARVQQTEDLRARRLAEAAKVAA
jgi:hypothetical protein